MKLELWRWSALDLADAICRGEVSSQEVIQATLVQNRFL